MTNNTAVPKPLSITELASELLVEDQDELHSPVPDSVSEPYGGITQDFRQDTVFLLDTEAESKQPGTLTGEKCPMTDIVQNSYEYLYSQYPYWRRLLSDEYMRNTKLDDKQNSPKSTAQMVLLHIDDHAWASIIHYLTATKFINTPDIYTKLCLDSGSPLSQLPASHIKLLSHKLPISKEEEQEWREKRKVDAWRRALLAKFAQNEDLQRALILTGWAKLVDKHGTPQHLLMWVRTVLRGDQQQKNSSDTKKEDKNLQEVIHQNDVLKHVLEVIEGLFGKDKHLLSSILIGSENKVLNKEVIEPTQVEMKDAVSYLEQIRKDEPPQSYHQFLEIMTDFRSEKINTPQVLERVTSLFKGKSWLIRNFLMFLPPGHIVELSPENHTNIIHITSSNGKKIIIDIIEGAVTFE